MLKEALGLGAQKYCIIRSYNPDFESFMILVLLYLPRENFCMYSEDESLCGPFLHTPWDVVGHKILSQHTPTIVEYLAYLNMRVQNYSRQE